MPLMKQLGTLKSAQGEFGVGQGKPESKISVENVYFCVLDTPTYTKEYHLMNVVQSKKCLNK